MITFFFYNTSAKLSSRESEVIKSESTISTSKDIFVLLKINEQQLKILLFKFKLVHLFLNDSSRLDLFSKANILPLFFKIEEM